VELAQTDGDAPGESVVPVGPGSKKLAKMNLEKLGGLCGTGAG